MSFFFAIKIIGGKGRRLYSTKEKKSLKGVLLATKLGKSAIAWTKDLGLWQPSADPLWSQTSPNVSRNHFYLQHLFSWGQKKIGQNMFALLSVSLDFLTPKATEWVMCCWWQPCKSLRLLLLSVRKLSPQWELPGASGLPVDSSWHTAVAWGTRATAVAARLFSSRALALTFLQCLAARLL